VGQKQVALGLRCHQLFLGPITLCFRMWYSLVSVIYGSKATLLPSRCRG